jgi:quaternary ammonium compound-resistance protein SugE
LILLLVAGVLEVGWAIGLKYTDGFTRLLAHPWHGDRNAPQHHPAWSFGESPAAARLLCLGLIVAGILGLKFLSPI